LYARGTTPEEAGRIKAEFEFVLGVLGVDRVASAIEGKWPTLAPSEQPRALRYYLGELADAARRDGGTDVPAL